MVVICLGKNLLLKSVLGHGVGLKLSYSDKVSKFETKAAQCARTDLNRRFLPKPMTTTG